MFGVLAIAERLFSRPDWTIAHVQPNADGLTAPGRPVYTMQPLAQKHKNVLQFCMIFRTEQLGSVLWSDRYLEWGINVPILFILSGYCSLGRPLQEVSRPLIVTNIYVIMCWAAAASTYGLQKWMRLFCTLAFSIKAWFEKWSTLQLF